MWVCDYCVVYHIERYICLRLEQYGLASHGRSAFQPCAIEFLRQWQVCRTPAECNHMHQPHEVTRQLELGDKVTYTAGHCWIGEKHQVLQGNGGREYQSQGYFIPNMRRSNLILCETIRSDFKKPPYRIHVSISVISRIRTSNDILYPVGFLLDCFIHHDVYTLHIFDGAKKVEFFYDHLLSEWRQHSWVCILPVIFLKYYANS